MAAALRAATAAPRGAVCQQSIEGCGMDLRARAAPFAGRIANPLFAGSALAFSAGAGASFTLALLAGCWGTPFEADSVGLGANFLAGPRFIRLAGVIGTTLDEEGTGGGGII